MYTLIYTCIYRGGYVHFNIYMYIYIGEGMYTCKHLFLLINTITNYLTSLAGVQKVMGNPQGKSPQCIPH